MNILVIERSRMQAGGSCVGIIPLMQWSNATASITTSSVVTKMNTQLTDSQYMHHCHPQIFF